jgi:hypothetical protein
MLLLRKLFILKPKNRFLLSLNLLAFANKDFQLICFINIGLNEINIDPEIIPLSEKEK